MKRVRRLRPTEEVWDTARGPVQRVADKYYLYTFVVGHNIKLHERTRITESAAKCLCTEENRFA